MFANGWYHVKALHSLVLDSWMKVSIGLPNGKPTGSMNQKQLSLCEEQAAMPERSAAGAPGRGQQLLRTSQGSTESSTSPDSLSSRKITQRVRCWLRSLYQIQLPQLPVFKANFKREAKKGNWQRVIFSQTVTNMCDHPNILHV